VAGAAPGARRWQLPKTKKGETRQKFVNRCIPAVIKEGGKSQEQAAGQCYGMYDYAQEKARGKRRGK
jgi:hypothetical protein